MSDPMKKNYQRMLDERLSALQKSGEKPRLLLHCCCAPCSSYVLEYLSGYFDITVFFHNPNISPREEFEHRADELRRLIREMPLPRPVDFRLGEYDPRQFDAIAAGHEDDPEGGERCLACYRLRLEETARVAAAEGYDCFTTTLSISPLKNADALNTIGGELAAAYGIDYLYSDFKKRDGYKRSCRLSAEYHLYRQNYCGCAYSKRDALRREKGKAVENGG